MTDRLKCPTCSCDESVSVPLKNLDRVAWACPECDTYWYNDPETLRQVDLLEDLIRSC